MDATEKRENTRFIFIAIFWVAIMLVWLLAIILMGPVYIKKSALPEGQLTPAEYDTVRAVYLGEFHWEDKSGALYFVEENDAPQRRPEKNVR